MLCRCHLATTECNHSYYTGNSFSAATRCSTVTTCVRLATPAQPTCFNTGGEWSCFFRLCFQLTVIDAVQSAHKSLRVPPVMAQVMSMPLAEAITQLSFLEFLQRCRVSIAPPQPSQPPVPISLLDAAVQTTPPCDVSQEVSTQTSDQQDTLSV